MKKFLGVMGLSTLMATNCMAFSTSVSIGEESVVKSVNENPKLYTFSAELLQSVADCSPYVEDFTKHNPELVKVGKMFGGDLAVKVNIKGKQEDKCAFDVTMKVGLLGKQAYECEVSDTEREALLNAMNDRTNEVVTETFDGYMTTEDEAGNLVLEKTSKYNMTDNRFNIEWAKVNQKCKLIQGELSEEEKLEEQKKFDVFEPEFLQSLQACEQATTTRKVLFLSETLDVLGWQNENCIAKVEPFIISIPKEKLENVQDWADIRTMMQDKTFSQYDPEQKYMKSDLMFSIDKCTKEDGSSGTQTEKFGEIKVKTSFKYEKTEEGCKLKFINLLNRDQEQEDFTKICNLPAEYVQTVKNTYADLIEQYGEKSSVDEEGRYHYEGATTNEQTEAADEKIWQEINERGFCE